MASIAATLKHSYPSVVEPTCLSNENKMTDKSYLQSLYVALAIPSVDGRIEVACFQSLAHLARICTGLGIRWRLLTRSKDIDITHARNEMVAEFLSEPDLTHIFFLDSDIGFNGLTVIRFLLARLPVVAGAYPFKSFSWPEFSNMSGSLSIEEHLSATYRYVYNPEQGRGVSFSSSGLLEAKDVATGFLCIQRDTFQRLKEVSTPYGHGKHMYFSTFIDNGRFLSEDYGFSRQCQKAGIMCYVDVVCQLSHTGRFTWRGRVYDKLIQNPVWKSRLSAAMGDAASAMKKLPAP